MPRQPAAPEVRRSIGELLKRADAIETARQRRQKEEARRKHEAEMKALAGREAETWQQVASLVDLKQTKSYDEAVQLLAKLAQLAEFRGSKGDYRRRVNDLCERYRRLSGFQWRVQQAKLLNDLISLLSLRTDGDVDNDSMNSPQGLRLFLFVYPLRSTSSTQGSVARHGKRVEQILVAGNQGLFFLSAPAFDLGLRDDGRRRMWRILLGRRAPAVGRVLSSGTLRRIDAPSIVAEGQLLPLGRGCRI